MSHELATFTGWAATAPGAPLERHSYDPGPLGAEEVEGILSERETVEVGCEFCGQQYQFDPVDAAQLFTAPLQQPPASQAIQ